MQDEIIRASGKLLAGAPLAFAGAAHGQIVYTPLDAVSGDISVSGAPGTSTRVDINFDGGGTDMRVRSGFTSGRIKVWVDGDSANSAGSNDEDEIFTALGSFNPLALAFGEEIDGTPGLGEAWTFASNTGTAETSDIWNSDGLGNFAADGVERYIGVRTVLDGNTHFGWISVVIESETSNSMNGFISGYAYNSVPGESILAGQIPAPGAGALALASGLLLTRRRRSA